MSLPSNTFSWVPTAPGIKSKGFVIWPLPLQIHLLSLPFPHYVKPRGLYSKQAKPVLSWGLCTCCSFCPEPLLSLLYVAAPFPPFRSELHQHRLLSKAFSNYFFSAGSFPYPPNLKAITSPYSFSLCAYCNLRRYWLWNSPICGKIRRAESLSVLSDPHPRA